jgi:hypothetical protein
LNLLLRSSSMKSCWGLFALANTILGMNKVIAIIPIHMIALDFSVNLFHLCGTIWIFRSCKTLIIAEILLLLQRSYLFSVLYTSRIEIIIFDTDKALIAELLHYFLFFCIYTCPIHDVYPSQKYSHDYCYFNIFPFSS